MSIPRPDITNFDAAATTFEACKPRHTELKSLSIAQSGNHAEWCVDYTGSGFYRPCMENMSAARNEFQRSEPRNTSVGLVSLCTIKLGGVITKHWQVRYTVPYGRPSPTSSDDDYWERRSPIPFPGEESHPEYRSDREHQLQSAIQEATDTLARTQTTTSSKKKKVSNKLEPQSRSKPVLKSSVQFVPASQHVDHNPRDIPYSPSDKDYIRISKEAYKYPTQDHLDARLIHITKDNVKKIPSKLIPLMSKAKRQVYYTIRRLLWKASKLETPERENEKLESESKRLQMLYADMSIKSAFNQIVSSRHPSEVCAALHHITTHHTLGRTNEFGNSTMSSLCTWSHSIIGPMRFRLDKEYLTKLLKAVNDEFQFTSEHHNIVLASKKSSLPSQVQPRDCISFKIA